MFDLSPDCPVCGAVIRDLERHQEFHDALTWTWKAASGVSDEEFERITGEPAGALAERLKAAVAAGRPRSSR